MKSGDGNVVGMIPRAGRVDVRVRVALVAVVAMAAAGCTAPAGVISLEPPPDTPVWMVGDSLASGTAAAMHPRPHQVVSGGAAFTRYAPSLILDITVAHIARHGHPATILVVGGVADVQRATPAEVIAGMELFKGEMESRGIRLIWIAEPGFTFAEQLVPVWEWVLAQPESIDCRFYKGWSIDGVHPVDYSAFARCVDAQVAALGVEFTLPVPP